MSSTSNGNSSYSVNIIYNKKEIRDEMIKVSTLFLLLTFSLHLKDVKACNSQPYSVTEAFSWLKMNIFSNLQGKLFPLTNSTHLFLH